MIKRILITGAGGMLGGEMINIFSKDHEYSVFGIVRSDKSNKPKINYVKADLRNIENLKKVIKLIKPDIIIHCAAIVSLDECEKNKKDADLIHVKVTKLLASYNKNKSKFLYISTDSIFDGLRGDYIESDRPHPLNYYAKSKLKGEKTAMKANKNSIVIRTNIYGFHVPPRNSFAEWAVGNLKSNKSINGFTDVIFNPVYTKQLARTVKYILEKKEITGILNISSDKYLSKYHFLKALAKSFGLNQKLIKPILINDAKMAIVRPKNTTLKISKLKKILNGEVLKFSDGLVEFKKDYLINFKV